MRSGLALLGAGVRANIIAGTRLALFLRVSRLEFRISAGHYAALVLVSLLFWAGGGIVREGLPESIDMQALTVALAQVPVLLLACVLAAQVFERPSLALAFAVLFTASDPLVEVVGTALRFLVGSEAFADWAGAVNWLYIGWGFAVMIRAQWLLTGWRVPRSIAASALFAAVLGAYVFLLPRNELWAPTPSDTEEAQPSVAREDLFHLQAGLLEYRLSELQPERPGVEDLYFVRQGPHHHGRSAGAIGHVDDAFETQKIGSVHGAHEIEEHFECCHRDCGVRRNRKRADAVAVTAHVVIVGVLCVRVGLLGEPTFDVGRLACRVIKAAIEQARGHRFA
jgi:hypothetical protein